MECLNWIHDNACQCALPAGHVGGCECPYPEEHAEQDEDMDYEEYGDAPEDEPEPEPAHMRQLPIMRYVTIALIMLAIIVQLGLVHKCTQTGRGALYCLLTE